MAQKQQPSFLGGLALGRAQHRPTPQREKTDSSTRPPVLLQNESSDGRSPRGPSHELERPHHLSLNGIGIRFILPAVVGGVYIIVGFWAAYRPQGPPIVSHSQDHSTEAKAGFTALLGIWSVVLLAPIWSTITDVRAEEWWRRLTGNRQATLGSCNNISSNRQGYLSLIRHCIRHPFETSPSLWLVIPLVIVTTILGNFIPGSFQISPGSATRPAPVKMPSLVNNPFNVSFSQPFNNLPRVNFSNRNIAHVYLDLQQTNAAEVGIATGATNILSPKPLLEGKATGATYATDIAGLSYTCEWVAPAFGGFVPGSTATSGLPNVQVQVKDVLGLTEVPRFGNFLSIVQNRTNATTDAPLFDGAFSFIVYGGSLDPTIGSLASFDVSSVPSAPLPALYQNLTVSNGVPVTNVSSVTCTPTVKVATAEILILDQRVADATSLDKPVGNLDEQSIKLALTDAYSNILLATPIDVRIPANLYVIGALFNPENQPSVAGQPVTIYTPLEPSLSEALLAYNTTPPMMHAYLDGTFGMHVDVAGKIWQPVLVLEVSKIYLIVCTALIAVVLLVQALLCARKPAVPLTLKIFNGTTAGDDHSHDHEAEHVDVPSLVGPDARRNIKVVTANATDKPAELSRESVAALASKVRGYSVSLFREQKPASWRSWSLVMSPHQHSAKPNPVERAARSHRRREASLFLIIPAFAMTWIIFGIIVWAKPDITLMRADSKDATISSAAFTTAMGIWATLALFSVYYVCREVNSEEWSRFMRHRHIDQNSPESLRETLDTISSNNISILEQIRAVATRGVSWRYRGAFLVGVVASVCGILAQGAIILNAQDLTSSATDTVTISGLAEDARFPAAVRAWTNSSWTTAPPLTTESTTPIFNFLDSATLIYLEEQTNQTAGNKQPAGYIVPVPSLERANPRSVEYVADVAQVQLECEWAKTTLVDPTNDTLSFGWTAASLPDYGVLGAVTLPDGTSSFTPFQTPTFANGTSVHTGMFGWTLWGGSKGDAVNLDAVNSTALSPAWLAAMNQTTIPELLGNDSTRTAVLTYPKRATTLLCVPNITTSAKVVTVPAFAGNITLADTKKPTAPVGNFDEVSVAWVTFMVASSEPYLAMKLIRPNVWVGAVPGATLGADPANPNSVAPLSGAAVAPILERHITIGSKKYLSQVSRISNVTVPYDLVTSEIVIAVSKPQFIASIVLFAHLTAMALWLFWRRRTIPFSLLGMLILADEIEAKLHPASPPEDLAEPHEGDAYAKEEQHQEHQ